MMDRMTLVDGVSMYELDQRLEKWVRFHNSTLMAGTIQALRLPEDVSRAHTHVLYILLEPRPYSEHNGEVGKFFRAVETEVVSIQDGMRKKAPWPGSLMQLSHIADDMERSGNGTVAAAIIECPPLQVQTVPFQSVSQSALRGEIVRDTWKSFFIQHIEQGVPM